MMSMLVKSNNSVNVDFPARYKALWIKNKLDGTEDHIVSERINYSRRPKTYAFQGKSDEENPSPKNLKDLLKLITPPKSVKRGKNANGSLTDKANELYDCDGDERPPSDDENEQTTESTNADEPFVDDTSTDTPPEREQNQRDPLKELAYLCNHPDLKNDAPFVDDLAKFTKTHDTSSKFLPHVTAIKK